VDIYVDNPLLTRQGARTYAGFNKLLMQKAISNPLKIKDLSHSALQQENFSKEFLST
jgi:hypothetical protein